MGANLSFEKVGERLYRNPTSRTYYALVKGKGKQHKRSLKTFDFADATEIGKSSFMMQAAVFGHWGNPALGLCPPVP